MMLTRRTLISLYQYLSLLESPFLNTLFEKHGLDATNLYDELIYGPPHFEHLEPPLNSAYQDQLSSLLEEIIRTQADLSDRADQGQRYYERWDDLVRCLKLNGYRIEDGKMVAVDPTIGDDPPVEDDLSKELKQSGLEKAQTVLKMLDKSADAFRSQPPEYNACLTNARVALQTLATAIAKARTTTYPGSFDETNWYQVSEYLQSSNLITKAETKGIKGVFGFVSPGAHIRVGHREEEMVRLGRSLVVSMCYFLVKCYNQ